MRLSKSVRVLAASLLALAVVLAVAPAGAEMITFEPTDPAVYVAGNTVIGVDGWEDCLFTGLHPQKALVTPVSGGQQTVLEGLQSVSLDGTSVSTTASNRKAYIQKAFAAGQQFVDGMTISSEYLVTTPSGTNSTSGGLFLNSKNATYVGGVVTSHFNAAGVGRLVTNDPNFKVFTSDTEAGVGLFRDTNVAAIVGHKYLLEMELDFTNGKYMSYYTDLTAEGSRTALTSAPEWFYTRGNTAGTLPPIPVTPEQLADSGGVSLTSRYGGAMIYDNVNIPEPSAIALLVAGLFGLVAYARRRR